MFERTFSGALGPYFSQIKEIVAGGNGRILSGIDTRYDFPVCIKRISLSNKEECRATLREIRIRRRLKHENIVSILNVIVTDGTEVSEIKSANFRDTNCLYVVQELLDADLRQVIESNSRLPDNYVKLFLYQLLRGLKYIHSANVLHRDLKPSNVMINVNSLQLMIGDFGHAMVLDSEYNHGTDSKVTDTSLWYKAPELILGSGQYSCASDVWAAGCILAEMMLGRPLYEAEFEQELLELIIHVIHVPQIEQSYIRRFLTKEVNTLYSGIPKFPLQSKFPKADIQALHLLENLLSFNPADRVTADLALSHPFLQEYSCSADEPVCLKPLHLEHEVDDFLEFTLKDLIVGECVALAEDQPRIHLQMSSYSSVTDLNKDQNISPSESTLPCCDENGSYDIKITGESTYEEACTESKGSRFKVLEVLKEEHVSSSDSNGGIATHEEGVSEAPLVLDHPMFSSSKWERERHKSGHRRHHHHRRKKKHHLKSPTIESDALFEKHLPEIDISEDVCNSGDCLQGLHTTEEERSSSPEETPTDVTINEGDKVQELLLRSQELITVHSAVNSVPSISDVCCHMSSCSTSSEVCCSLSSDHRISFDDAAQNDVTHGGRLMDDNQCGSLPPSCVHEKLSSSLGDLLGLQKTTVNLGIAEVVRRSQELLGDTCVLSSTPRKTSVGENRMTWRSEETLSDAPVLGNTSESEPLKGCMGSSDNHVDNYADDLIRRSQQLLKVDEVPEETNETEIAEKCGKYDVKNESMEVSTEITVQMDCDGETLEKFDCDQPFSEMSLSFKDNASNTMSNVCNNVWSVEMYHSQSDPYNLRQTDKRMNELFKESHSLLKEFKTDTEEDIEDFPMTEEVKKQDYDSGIDLDDMKSVFNQAKQLLLQTDESDNWKRSLVDCNEKNDCIGNDSAAVIEVERADGTDVVSRHHSNVTCPDYEVELIMQKEDENMMEKSDDEENRTEDILNTSLINTSAETTTIVESLIHPYINLSHDIHEDPLRKYETAQPGDLFSTTNHVLDKLYGHNHIEKNARSFNLKDGARLHHLCKHLKLRSIIRHRSHREKRHDTYPF